METIATAIIEEFSAWSMMPVPSASVVWVGTFSRGGWDGSDGSSGSGNGVTGLTCSYVMPLTGTFSNRSLPTQMVATVKRSLRYSP